MSTYRLDRLFQPRSVALLGGSPRTGSLGRTVLERLRSAGFGGTLNVVNPRHAEIGGMATVPSLRALPEPPEVVVVTAPAPAVPGLLEEAGALGVGAAVVISAGLGHGAGSHAEAALQAARRHGLRLVGPNGLGVIVPPVKFNASFAARLPASGDLAVISQSGAVAAGFVEWAATRAVGFSAIVSLGDAIDVDFGDLLDYFAQDRNTRAILLYIEAIRDARKFMSAARIAARIKPVLVIKSGRHAQGAKAAATHTGALAGSDEVYDAAFRRAGLVRAYDLDEMFAATETLGRLKPFPGRRLAILTNGGGLGVLAVDRLIDLGGSVAELSPATKAKLDDVLPPGWSGSNPVDIIGDADGARYAAALATLLEDPANDAVLVMNVPTALASANDAARAVVDTARRQTGRSPNKPVFATWIGEDREALQAFENASIPRYANEAEAVQGFMHLVRYREATDVLMETPPSLPEAFQPDTATARAVIDAALHAGHAWLGPLAIARILRTYDIPATPVLLARSPEEAAQQAGPLLRSGQSVVAKILSPDIVHKSEVGGVRLNLTSAEAVERATAEILASASAVRPDARITGVTLHPMVVRPKARELIAGIADDPTFGPIVVFGRGGTAVEVINDKALALPPLDIKLARDLMARTRVSRILKAYRDVPAADESAVALTLVKLAQLAADIPEIRELDLNPMLADKDGVTVVDARMAIAPLTAGARGRRGHPRFAIRPYPKEWERHIAPADGTRVFLRPVRPEDEGLYREFFLHVTPEDFRLRFFAPVREFSHAFLARLTQLDYARSMAFMALDGTSGAMLGAVRLHADANYETGEYAILVRSDLKGRGLGWRLMQLMIDYAAAEGLRAIEGQVLRQNTTMLAMCRQLGFSIAPDPADHDIYVVRLPIARREPFTAVAVRSS
jgi:acetyltransferase